MVRNLKLLAEWRGNCWGVFVVVLDVVGGRKCVVMDKAIDIIITKRRI